VIGLVAEIIQRLVTIRASPGGTTWRHTTAKIKLASDREQMRGGASCQSLLGSGSYKSIRSVAPAGVPVRYRTLHAPPKTLADLIETSSLHTWRSFAMPDNIRRDKVIERIRLTAIPCI
jgi:hypothetical protein